VIAILHSSSIRTSRANAGRPARTRAAIPQDTDSPRPLARADRARPAGAASWRKLMLTALVLIAATLLPTEPAHALVIIDPDASNFGSGTGNTSAPAGFPYWANIFGNRIHVGNGFYIKTTHTGSGSNSGLDLDILKFEKGSSTESDLRAGTGTDFGHDVVPIITSPVSVGEELLIVGNGERRGSQTTWDITFNAGANNDVWSDPSTDGTPEASGFKTKDSGTNRWGTNKVADTGLVVTISGRDTHMFATSFSLTDATEWEAQGSAWDSDGVAFVNRNGQWRLAGIMHAIAGIDESQNPIAYSPLENLPSFDALLSYQNPGGTDGDVAGNFSSATFFSDLSFYNDQLLDLGFAFALPEPGSATCLAILLPALLHRRRAARRARIVGPNCRPDREPDRKNVAPA